jgi:hypothetical protein
VLFLKYFLQQFEAGSGEAPKQAAWGAPTPTAGEVTASLSAPLLQSPAAVAARKDASARAGAAKATVGDSKLVVRPAGAGKGRPTTSAGRTPAPPPKAPGADVVPAPGESFTATQIRVLEAEVEHLRDTLDVLMTAQSGERAGGRSRSSNAPSRRPGASGLRTTAATLTSSPAVHNPEERAAAEYASHQHNRALLASTLADRKAHDTMAVALSKQALALASPTLKAELSASQYTRVEPTAGLRATTPSRRPVVLPRPLSASPARSSAPPSPASSAGKASRNPAPDARRASMASRRASAPSGPGIASIPPPTPENAAKAALREKRHKALQAEAAAAESKSESKSESKEEEAEARRASVPKPSAAAARRTLPRPATAASRSRPSTAAAPADAGLEGAADRTLPRPASASARTAGPELSKEEQAAAFASLASGGKKVAATTDTKGFTFSAKVKGISDEKFESWMASKRAEEDAALSFRFKAMPIAPATRDLHLYKRIMDKLAARRVEAHHERATKLASTLKPFEVVLGHCEEHAARLAARRARFLLDEQRELAEGRKFKALPVPNLADPSGSFAALVRREAERPQRVAAMAREFYSTAALPVRMALAVETERSRTAARAARIASEEAADRSAHAFKPAPLPDFTAMHTAFEDGLTSKKLASVAAMGGLTVPKTFGFDEPARITADLVRAEKWTREAELQTSTSMALRRRSSAYGEGAGLTPEPNPTATTRAGGRPPSSGTHSTRRPASAGASLSETLSSSSAPPASMTKSVQLKMLEVQRLLRESQAKDLERVQADEAYYRFCKESTSRFAPIFQQMERARVPKPLAWQMDAVAASASDTRQAFERQSRERAAYNKERIAAAAANRPLVMLASTIKQAADTAKAGALRSVGDTAARSYRGPSATWRTVVDNGLGGTAAFSADEKELMSYPDEFEM